MLFATVIAPPYHVTQLTASTAATWLHSARQGDSRLRVACGLLRAAHYLRPIAIPAALILMQSVPPPLDLVAEEVEPLAATVERQRVRANRLLALSLEERSALIAGVRGNGNGSDDDTAG
jgi:hypothetical protein